MDTLLRLIGLEAGTIIYGSSVADWALALGLGLTTFAVLLVLRRLLGRRTRRYLGRELPRGVRLVLRLVEKTRIFPLLALSLTVGSKYLDLGARAEHVTTAAIVILVAVQVGLWASAAVRFYIEENSAVRGDRSARTMVTIVQFTTNLLIWSLVLLLVLDNLGIQVKALLTGLGIGGIAVALAVQNIFGDLLASLSIALDRPFDVGDALTLDSGYSGTVEAIGIKSTRLRSTTGEQIVISNAELVKARIRNFGRLAARRSVFRLGVAYGTPSALLGEVTGIVRSAVDAQSNATFERAHCVNFGATAIEYEAAFVVTSADYNHFLDAQQAVNLAIVREFERRGIQFGQPPAPVVVVREGSAPSVA